MPKYTKPNEDQLRKLGVNPYLTSLSIPAYKFNPSKAYVQDSDGTLVPVEVLTESSIPVKLYTCSSTRLIVSGFTNKAQRLYLWLLYETETNKDYICVNKPRYMKENGITSVNTYTEAIKELIRYGFIHYTTHKEVYWLNPDHFYRGSRIKQFPTNVVIKTDSTI